MRNDFETGYLMHWGIKKGGKKENHKYYERVEKNGKYLYFYTQAEYEAWLHKGNKALDKTKDKAKNALSSLKSKLTNTRSSLLNAVAKGREASYQLANRSSLMLKKSNTQQVIDRGSKTISSLLNKTSKQVANVTKTASNLSKSAANAVSKQAQNLQKSSKAASANIQQKAKKIADNVSKTIKQAGKDASKAIKQYQAKGENAINDVLKKAGNTKMSMASKKTGGIGTSILASILATVAISAIAYVAPKVAKKQKN